FAIAQAVFALTYAHKKVDVIPDLIPNLGRADDSSVVRAVLIQNEKWFAKYAAEMGFNWSKITSKP
ncbi:MAG TPA: YkvA family protein, partial [Verrucomicrobiae bacterium]|nr:YkvA family protein [Verrucomicrobiae bacterium]